MMNHAWPSKVKSVVTQKGMDYEAALGKTWENREKLTVFIRLLALEG